MCGLPFIKAQVVSHPSVLVVSNIDFSNRDTGQRTFLDGKGRKGLRPAQFSM